MDAEMLADKIFEEAIAPYLDDLGSVQAQLALEKQVREIIRAERLACYNIAESHAQNCAACGCDSWQIAEKIKERKECG